MRKTIFIAGAAICIICAALISYDFIKFTQRDAIPSQDLTLSEEVVCEGVVVVIGENASQQTSRMVDNNTQYLMEVLKDEKRFISEYKIF